METVEETYQDSLYFYDLSNSYIDDFKWKFHYDLRHLIRVHMTAGRNKGKMARDCPFFLVGVSTQRTDTRRRVCKLCPTIPTVGKCCPLECLACVGCEDYHNPHINDSSSDDTGAWLEQRESFGCEKSSVRITQGCRIEVTSRLSS